MLFGIKKSHESSEKKSSPQEGNTKNNKLAKGSIEPGDSLADQAANLKETLNERTRDLEKTEEQLVKLSNSAESSDGDKEAPIQPNKPIAELLVGEEEEASTEKEELSIEKQEPPAVKQEPPAGDNDLSSLLGGGGEEGEEGGPLSNLFDQEDDEVNPLAGLITSLPSVTAMELINEAQETKEMIREWQQS